MSGIRTKIIYCVVRIADDYHGGLTYMEAFTDEDLAKKRKADLESKDKGCPECGDVPHYTVSSLCLKVTDDSDV